MKTPLPHLYLITDRQQLADKDQFLEIIAELLQAGVKMIQLREKDLSAAELYPLAKSLRKMTHHHNCRLIINDRIDLALAVKADGVHLGNHSLPINVARKILGSRFLIGASTHSAAEVESASRQGADFVTYGPIYFTPSKAGYGNPVGVESLHDVATVSSIPIYALGGIKEDNARTTLEAGAHGIAVISALLSAPSPTRAYKSLSEHILSAKNK
jgi:thiamine-phosphate pyrophosphorylase